jgi:hypothetical protein
MPQRRSGLCLAQLTSKLSVCFQELVNRALDLASKDTSLTGSLITSNS